jgi:hypothetical protein
VSMMPPEQPMPPVVDPGNPFLGQQYPANLMVGPVQGTPVPMLVLTIRCGPATLSVLLSREDAQTWAKMIADHAAKTSPLIVPNGMPQMPALDPRQARP